MTDLARLQAALERLRDEAEHAYEGHCTGVQEADLRLLLTSYAALTLKCEALSKVNDTVVEHNEHLLARAEAAEAALSPRKATKAMRLAGLQELPLGPSSPAHAGACWTAMWDAAHPQPQAPVMGGGG